MSEAREFLAVIVVNGTGSTFRRGVKPPADLAAACAKQARKDWGSLFAIPKGHQWTVSIFDVTDHPSVYWDADGVFDKTTEQPLKRHSIETPTA